MILDIANTFSLLISFLLGIGLGVAFFSIGYLVIVLSSMQKKNYIVQTQVKDVSDEEIKELIKQTQAMFKDSKIKGEDNMFSYCKDLTYNLVLQIAKKFYPKSKHPLFEISIDELLLIAVYISKRLDEILDRKLLRMFRKLKISTLVGLGEVYDKFEESKIIKATKKYKIMGALKAAKSVINVVNPVYWIRKIVTNTALKIATKKLCLVIIAIAGEETYKIYSKSCFNKDVSIDTGVDEIVSSMEEDISKDMEASKLSEDYNNSEVLNERALDNEEVSTTKDLPKKKKFKLFHRKKKTKEENKILLLDEPKENNEVK